MVASGLVTADFVHRETSLAGLRVSRTETGSGPPLLLVHGFVVNHHEWDPILPLLAPHFRCIAVDLPGFGGSDRPRNGAFDYSWTSYAAVLAELLAALGLERAHVCGHSMGGGIAAALAANYPSVVDRLVLIDSASYPFALPLKARLPFLPGIGPILFKRLYGRSMFRDYFRNDVFNGGVSMNLARVDAYYDDFDSPEGRDAAYRALTCTVAKVDQLPPLFPKINAKTLVVWGERDRIFPVRLGERLSKEIPSARLEVIPHSGHAPNEEYPQRTADLIRAHLTG